MKELRSVITVNITKFNGLLSTFTTKHLFTNKQTAITHIYKESPVLTSITMNFFHGQKSWTYSFDFLSNLHNISLCNVALTVKRELYYAMLYIGNSENEIGYVQLPQSLVVRQSLSNCLL